MIARVVVELLREAAAEYAIRVVDGRLANPHEYQDAYGFTQSGAGVGCATRYMGMLESAKITTALHVRQHLLDIARRVIAGQSPFEDFRTARGRVTRGAPQASFRFKLRGAAFDQMKHFPDHAPVRRTAGCLEPRVEALGQIDGEPLDRLLAVR